MGAWGAGPFENDDAADFAAELEGLDADDGVQVLTDALAATDTEYVEAPDASIAVAAAQVVVWMRSPDALPDDAYAAEALTWITAAAPVPTADLLAAARRAVARVSGEDSELAELWADSDEADAWRAALDRIDAALR